MIGAVTSHAVQIRLLVETIIITLKQVWRARMRYALKRVHNEVKVKTKEVGYLLFIIYLLYVFYFQVRLFTPVSVLFLGDPIYAICLFIYLLLIICYLIFIIINSPSL